MKTRDSLFTRISSPTFLLLSSTCCLWTIGCTTTPDGAAVGGASSTMVATPVAVPGKPAKEEEKVAIAKKPEESPKPIEEKKDATTLAAEAKALVKWSSSEAMLREAFELSGEAADLAPKDSSIALQHARHAVHYGQTVTGIDRPAKISKEALASMDAAGLSGDSLDPTAAYYRASLTGLVMQAQGLAAAGKLPELEKLFTRSTASPGTERGGPWRALGMIYLKAPPWPTGIGDIELAIENLEKAAQSYGDFPHNHICLARALAEDGNRNRALQSLTRAEELLASGNWGGLGIVWKREIAEIRGNLG